MPKPNKNEKSRELDDDYEVVSFEEFCDKPSNAKTDLLSLNDNINYRIYYESLKLPKDGSSSNIEEAFDREAEGQKETSLNGPKGGVYTKLPFAPFGKGNAKSRAPLFSGIIPRPRSDGDTSREPRYQRFSQRRTTLQRAWEQLKNICPGMLGVGLMCVLCVAVWLVVGGTLGGAWTEDKYRKLWQRVHPENTERPMTYYEMVVPEVHYHDHNNLSTKNKFNGSEGSRKTPLDDEKYQRLMRPMPIQVPTEAPETPKYLERTPEILRNMCSNVTDNMRFDCYPQTGANEEACLKRGCCWRSTNIQGAPYCFYPPNYDTYKFYNMTENKRGVTAYYALNRPSGYPGDFRMVRVDIMFVTGDIINAKISDAENPRFEAQYPEIPMVYGSIKTMKYKMVLESSSIGFKVVRLSDNVTVFNTQSVGGLILSDKFLQVSSLLPTNQIYGLGERRARFRTELNEWKTFTMFNSDQAPVENTNLYGTQPFYLALEPDGKAHGTLLLNSHAIDVVLQPTPAITYRTIGGLFNFYMFLGPSPSDVVSQLTEIIGKPFMPPYWALGFHLCKYNYGSLQVTRDVWKSNRDAGIPLDVQWNDLDYMKNGNDFTYDDVKFKGLPEFVKELHDAGMHYMVLIDPGVSAAENPGTYPPFDKGLEMNIFIKNSTGQPFVGKVWNKVSTVWPDFTHPNATMYWTQMMSNFHKKIQYDGAWIDMNEPSNFVSGSLFGECEPEDLPYTPYYLTNGLKHKTLCMDAHHYAGKHYQWHNLYGLTEAISTHFALVEIRGSRPFIISRASFPGLGRYAGHWSGDVDSSWHDFRMSIPELLSFSLFGIPMMGADICGFRGNTTVELCKRWMQLGAFYPFSRNHNSDSSMPQDPVSLGAEVVSASRTALRTRYSLLPYYYTLFWRAHLHGELVARPLYFDDPSDTTTHEIDTQLLIGPYLLISPILYAGTNSARAYFPAGIWYSLDGTLITSGWRNVTEQQMLAVKGGGILPLQEPPEGVVSTRECRTRPLHLVAAPDAAAQARAMLYWDDGLGLQTYDESKYSLVHFILDKQEFRSELQWWAYGMPTVNKITIFGQKVPIKNVTVNQKPCKKPVCDFSYSSNSQIFGCETCGSKDCSRHNPDVAPEPWSGLLIHKQLDQAIEDFYNAILDQFINTWYSKITLQPFFIDELRLQLRYASASLLKRALKIDYGRLITERLVPCALRHYAVVSSGAKPALHVAACNRAAEMKYLRSLTEVLLPLVLQPNETNSSVFRVLVREVFAGWVLLSLTDVLADPYILNALIILATSDEKMSELPTTPNYKVEFLETFTRQTECVYSARCKLLQLDVETVLSQQEQLYAFMQHLKSSGHLQLLQFYKDIKLFQTTLLNPELSSVEREALAGSARALAAQCARLRLPQHMLRDLRHDLDSADVHKLQTSRALYQAARQSHAALEKVLLPRYLHSEEFYKLLIGSRVPTGYQKQMAKRQQDKLFNAAMKLGSRLKGALRSQAIDGQVLDCCNSELEDEGMENLDILKYLDSIAAEDSMEQDLANFKVVLTNVETQLQAPPRRGTVRVFTLAVHRAGGAVGAAGAGGAVGAGGAALWGARRTEHDFHLLRAKLQEFHGDALHDLALPSRRDNSPLETLRYKYEDFLQRLLQKPLLQTSELLYLFLTVDGDFSLVVQASTLNANSTDLGNIYHSVAHKLRKEKGQHLESFLRNFLVSSDKERYQALKQGVRDVEEALEADEGSSLRAWANSAGGAAGGGRGARGQVFGDNFAEPPPAPAPRHSTHQTAVVGFTHCFMYLLVKVVKAPMFLCGILGSLLAMARTILDDAFNSYLNRTLSTLLCERRLAHLIQLGHGLLFGKKSLSPRTEVEKQRESARAQLLRRVPAPLSGLHAALNNAFDIIQSPHLNKQLVYSLLDLCVLELFPELQDKGVTNS
ncbi:PREDICTED: uncharacterized protein LOC106121193 [Papilio xuthus]|uniref:Uncharacterized protein LOC106121193 n=1 Tax=Papilio xuthus TaxID=66420 RepID=A0AAJ7ECS0_PAPXU|nr:PREDICTED: uncharacterized protein LOC106121193 [Papilio xuthus]